MKIFIFAQFYFLNLEINFRPRWLFMTDPEECKQLEVGYNEHTLNPDDGTKAIKQISATHTVNFINMTLKTPEGRFPVKRVHFMWLWKGDDAWVAYSQHASVIIHTSYLMREPWADLSPADLGLGGGTTGEYRVVFAKMRQHKITNEQRSRRVAFITSPEAPCFPLTIPLIYGDPAKKGKIVYPDYWEPFANDLEYYKAVNISLTSSEAKKIDASLNKSIFPGGRNLYLFIYSLFILSLFYLFIYR